MMMMMIIIICIRTHSFLSISGLTAIFQVDLVSRYQNVSSAYIIAAKGDGVTTAAMTCKAPVKSSPPTNQHPGLFLQRRSPHGAMQ